MNDKTHINRVMIGQSLVLTKPNTPTYVKRREYTRTGVVYMQETPYTTGKVNSKYTEKYKQF